MKDDQVIAIQKKLLPQPIFSVVLLITWLLAYGSIALATIGTGLVWALIVPMFTARFWPEAPPIRRWRPLLLFTFVMIFDIIIANLTVARLILGPTKRLQPCFLEIPLELDHPFAITILASAISLTPGTVSANLSGDRRTLLVHALDCPSNQVDTQISLIKARYEAPLKEIFEC
ncbi:MAG: Na+/H+ antiporter subunit E [Bradymonadaceae bacterium]|nr:Na+/H+ antiporter subunit E [Lujinxingiaceae bacterium]